MLRLSRKGIGVLTSQYKSVLRKCVLLNMLAAGVFLFAPNASAETYATGADLPTMGTEIGIETANWDSAYIYYYDGVGSNLTKEMFSDDLPSKPSAWIVNFGDVYVGEKPNADGGNNIIVNNTVVSNKHNTFTNISLDAASGGGAISNRVKYVDSKIVGADLYIHGSTLENNSSTDFTEYAMSEYFAPQAVGGAISNTSSHAQIFEETLNAPTRFINNYAMQFVNAFGGAVYNGFVIDTKTKELVDVAKTDSTGTIYDGNHAGNEIISSIEEINSKIMEQLHDNSICPPGSSDCPERTLTILDHTGKKVDKYALTDYAFGGAVYNIGEYNSTNETYQNNYTIGMRAFGGAIYNSNFNHFTGYIEDDGYISDMSSFNISGDITFTNNEVVSWETDPAKGQAYGGAVYNVAKMNFADNSSVEFENNRAISYYDSRGGAIMNEYLTIFGLGDEAIGEISTIRNATFSNNTAYTEGDDKYATARGGAIYNAGKLTIADATFKNNSVSGAGTEVNYGGAIYNGANEELTGGYLQFDNEKSSKTIDFIGNYAQNKGGALFNYGGTIRGVISKQLFFQNNEDVFDSSAENKLDDEHERHASGAIYNAVAGDADITDAEIKLLLVGKGNVVFKTHGYDNVYNDVERDDYDNIIVGGTKGLIQFGGQNFTARAFGMQNAGSDKSYVKTYATFGGYGNYEIVNTEFVLDADSTGAGYIGYNPSMNMAYNKIILHSQGNNAAHMYLSSDNDAVIDNDFYLDANTTLRYDDKDPTWVTRTTIANAYGIADGKGGYVYNEQAMLSADEAAGDTVNDYINFSKYFQHEADKNFYLGQYVNNSGFIVYNDENRADTDIGIADYLVNNTGGVIHSGYDGYITKNIHIGTLDSEGGKITINMNNTDLVTMDKEHKLIPLDNIPEGYQFGYYEGKHYVSEVLTIDKSITHETIVVFYKEAAAENEATAYPTIDLDVGQRIYFAQTPGTYGVDPELYSFKVENGNNPNYEIKVGYDYNDLTSVYDWFLYRDSITPPPSDDIPPEVIAMIDLPRSAIEQVRSLRIPLNRTNKGQCNCYADKCDNRFCKFEDANFKARMWATPFYRTGTFEKPVETDFDLFGVDFGMDFQPTTKDQIGFFGSYRNGKYENDGNKKHAGEAKKYFSYDGSSVKLESWLGGAYYRRYIGDLYLMGSMFGGKIDADLKGKNGVKAAIDGVTVGAQAEMGYDIRMTNRSVLTPLVRGTYNFIDFDKGTDSVGKEVEFGDIHNFEIEGALKLEYQFNGERELPTTGYIKPSVVQMLASGGEVTVDGKEYKDTLDNETIGRVEVGFDAELIKNFSLGVFGNYSFGSDYDAWGVGGNVRIIW